MIIEKEMTKTQPLVSIVVITYNSSKYVLETLESAKEQTYQNIELIISDDCSTDNTVEICRQWLEHNKERFVHAELITALKNTGITPNCNRGVNASKGTWVKYFAGDDLLLPDCITHYIEYINVNRDCHVLFGKVNLLSNGKITNLPVCQTLSSPHDRQYKQVLKGASIQPQAAFYSRFALDSVGGFNENYVFCDDFLMYICLAEKGYKFYFIDSFVAIYRDHDLSISANNKNNKFINTLYFNDLDKCISEQIIPRYYKEKLFLPIINSLNYSFTTKIIIALGNRNNKLSKLISYLYICGTIGSIKRLISKLLSHLQNY